MGEHSIWLWVGFGALILFMLSLDLGLFKRKSRTITYKESAIWSAVWVSLAMVFAGVVFWHLGAQKGVEFVTGYLIELSLSVDNLFVFLLVFAYFKVPAEYQHRVLFWGVMGALIMRVIMIFVGAGLISRFHWLIYVFGAFLVYTGVKMFRSKESEVNPEDNSLVHLVTRFVPITRHYEGEKFFTVENGRRVGTLLFLVLIIVEVTDLVFAVDSIPAIFGIFRSPEEVDPFIVYTSNVFAILGLRSLYFLLAGVVEKFHYLKLGLAVVLTFIGVKMLLPLLAKGAAHALNYLGAPELAGYAARADHVHIGVALGFVATVLAASVLASIIWPKKAESHIEVDLPPGFGQPFKHSHDKRTHA